jgi:FAD synthase
MEVAKWDVKNHGGNPTTNESEKYAIFVGRFQPYHQGHISLIMQKNKCRYSSANHGKGYCSRCKKPFHY